MRKLADIKGEEGIIVIGNVLPIIEKMVKKTGRANTKLNESGEAVRAETTMEYIGRMLRENPSDTLNLMAAIDNVPVEEYKEMSLIGILQAVTEMINDQELVALFN